MTKIQELIEKADNAFFAADYDKAIGLYKQVLELSPKNKHSQQYLRKAEELKKLIENADDAYYVADYDKAIQLYKQVLDLDTSNKHAQGQIPKAERSRSSKSLKSIDVPPEALQLYMRSRSFIAVKDLDGAKELLKQAIDLADEAGVDFSNARELLGNIHNALQAEEIKKIAFEELELQQWVKAEADLKKAIDLDPTDDVVHTLLLHLQSLIKAHSLIKRLNARRSETRSRSAAIKKIREIINLTDETTALSKLWQEVVKLFNEYNEIAILGNIVLIVLSTVGALLIAFWFLYLYPRHRGIEVECESVASGLQAELNYPHYAANGDVEKIEITFKNTSKSVFNGSIKIDFEGGTAKVRFDARSKSNVIEIENLVQGEERLETIYFYVDGSTSEISSPWYINFSIGACIPEIPYTPKDLHIAMTPIPNLHAIWLWLLGGSGTVTFIVAFFRQRIIDIVFKKDNQNLR